ncbi:MAG: hypothetical protein AB7Q45_03700 [Planctomycetaceae bacterium]
MNLRPSPVACLSALLLLAGCSSGTEMTDERLASMAGGKLKETVKVSGKVLVDGTPQPGVNIHLYGPGGGAEVNNCRTGEDGTYCWSTHVSCDGLEAGSYRLAFEYVPKEKKNDEGTDLFKGKYRNPAKNDFTLTVEKGVPQTDVNYELKLSAK